MECYLGQSQASTHRHKCTCTLTPTQYHTCENVFSQGMVTRTFNLNTQETESAVSSIE